MSRTIVRLLLALSSLAALGVAAAPASAAPSASLNADTVTFTTNAVNEGWGTAAVTILAKGPGVGDDVVRFTPVPAGSGCPIVSGGMECALTFAGTPRTKISINSPTNLAEDRWTVDLDRPGVRMTLTIVLGGASAGDRVDGTPTTVGAINASVADGGTLIGGADDDALSGSNAGDILEGGPGDDALVGGKGNDVLRGGPGDDGLVPGEGTNQTVDGGEGTQDSISFGAETVPVAVSFDGVANDGPQGRPVTITGVEAATGGLGDDTLVGDAGFNHLYGLSGNDTVDGGGGGHDVLRGGPGDDTMRARDASPLFGDVACASGADAAIVDVLDIVAADCETVDRAPAPPGFVPPGSQGAGGTAGDRVAPVLTVTVGKSIRRSRLGRGVSVRVRTNERATVSVELLATARRVASTAALTDNLVLARVTRRGLTGSAAGRLRPQQGLLARARKLAVRVTAIDDAGNRRVVTRRLSVR